MVGHVLKLTSDRVYEFYEPVFNCSITRIIFNLAVLLVDL